jgi:molybdopterin-guanine dinucleotide biosynthesis protein A
MTTPLFGLILAGGASTRMQRDKATLQYHGRTQLEWAYDLVSKVCAATFVSVRAGQRDEPTRAKFPQIIDRQPGLGPLAGISAALLEHPKAAWLVVACDLPFLDQATLEKLLEERDAARTATAYRSAHDGLPEPLCAIWEPAARDAIQTHIAAGKQCPRKLLINADCKLIDLPDPRALDNVNTGEEFETASALLAEQERREEIVGHTPAKTDVANGSQTRISLRVQYFAVLREQAGRSEEMIDSGATTAAQLYEQLKQRHRFQLSPAQLKVAVNSEFSDWQVSLKHGDTVVFIPPVAGG